MYSIDAELSKIPSSGDREGGIYEGAECSIIHTYLADILSRSTVKNPTEAAVRLLSEYGSIDAVISRDADELAGVVGESSAILLKLLAYIDSRRVCDSFRFGRRHSDAEILDLLSAVMIGLSRETVYMVSVNDRGAVVACDMIGEGTVNASDIYPRKLVECAIKRGAVAVYLAHNHPSGTADPSNADIAATSRVFSTFRAAGIKLCGHAVIAERQRRIMVPNEITGEINVTDAI